MAKGVIYVMQSNVAGGSVVKIGKTLRFEQRMKELEDDLKKEFEILRDVRTDELIEARYQKFRRAGYRSY